jgi:hypothetical protein
MGVNGSGGVRRRPSDQPDRYSSKDGRKKRREQNCLWPVHRIDLLEVFEIQDAGPAVFAIDQAKNDLHGTNSVVDYATKIAALCFRLVSSGTKIDFDGPEIGFRRCPRKMAGDRTPHGGLLTDQAPFTPLSARLICQRQMTAKR